MLSGISILLFILIWLNSLKSNAANMASNMTDNFVESQKKLEARNVELEESLRQLKVLDDSKDNFIDMISHEIRTPLTVLNGYANLFLE